MTREGPFRLIHTPDFDILISPGPVELVGDRYVPWQMDLDFPAVDGEPGARLTIEIRRGVPRCTGVEFRSADDGREVRPKDLRALSAGIDTWVELAVSLASATPETAEAWAGDPSGATRVHGIDPEDLRRGVQTIRQVRRGARRPMTDTRRQRVAEIYNSQESGGIEAVQAAFGVSRSTAARYINSAREAGLIERRTR